MFSGNSSRFINNSGARAMSRAGSNIETTNTILCCYYVNKGLNCNRNNLIVIMFRSCKIKIPIFQFMFLVF